MIKKREEEVILGIEAVRAIEVLGVMYWANSVLLSASLYTATIPNAFNPEASGKRSPASQIAYIEDGKSWWSIKNVKRAPHVLGYAIHIGLRYRKTGKYIPWDRMSKEAREVFMLIVAKMKALGWRWLGPKDPNHFDKMKL